MTATPFDELVHRINNLLGTIELQVAVARGDGSVQAHGEALTRILESAHRVHDDVQRLRAAVRAAAVPPEAPHA